MSTNRERVLSATPICFLGRVLHPTLVSTTYTQTIPNIGKITTERVTYNQARFTRNTRLALAWLAE